MSGSAELLAPAGDFETALAAFDAGADAVYCGLSDFSARAFATNFSIDHLKDLVRYAHAPLSLHSGIQTPEHPNVQTSKRPNVQTPRRVYVTFNTVIDEANFEEAIDRLSRLEQTGVDAIIVQDLGVARICRKFFPGLALHASTQLVAHNLEGVLALKEIGFTRVVLARELSLSEITQIKQRCGDVELEVFIHGALCYSISGLCLYGAMEKGRSGNRGKCPYCCRQEAGEKVKRKGEGEQRSGRFCSSPSPSSFTSSLYPFSMKDLRLGEDVKKLAEAGVASLKIEGRMKSPLYVASVVKWYRQFLAPVSVLRAPSRGTGTVPEIAKQKQFVTSSDLETVFSRRTTELLFNIQTSKHPNLQTSKHPNLQTSKRPNVQTESPIDPDSLGHLGTPIGTVKRITRDREGRAWLRFHTMRALEKHDGLQFDALTDEGRHFGFGIQEMRQAISRAPVFEVSAGEDIEVLLPEDGAERIPQPQLKDDILSSSFRANFASSPFNRGNGIPSVPIRPGDKVYCSMSNAVKRKFPVPSFRSSDYPGFLKVDVEVSISADTITATVLNWGCGILSAPSAPVSVSLRGVFDAAKNPEKTYASVEKAFSKFGETDYSLGKLTVNDPEHRFAPMSVLNDLRRDLVEKLDDFREAARQAKVDDAVDSLTELSEGRRGKDSAAPVVFGDHETGDAEYFPLRVLRTVKIRADQSVPGGDWDEVIVAINLDTDLTVLRVLRETSVSSCSAGGDSVRLALPVWNGELEFNKIRTKVKSLIREGFVKWECSDLATLRLLKSCGVTDITADWTLYAFNASALAELAEKGVRRFVASPENGKENLQYLAESGYAVEFLKQQSTPLFISLHEPASTEVEGLAIFRRDDLWITTKPLPRSFDVPSGASSRIDLSWDPEAK